MTNLNFNSLDSFAFWNAPKEDLSGKTPDNIQNLFKESYQENTFPNELLPADLESYLKQLKYVLVGMNPGNAAVDQPADKLFLNFHGLKGSADYRLAAAVYNTPLWGTFITDLSHTIESSSPNVKFTQEDVLNLEKHLRELGVPDNATIISLGKGDSYKQLVKYSTHPVEYIYHYSNSNNAHWKAPVVKKQIAEIVEK